MDASYEALETVCTVLEALGVRHMVCGSLASSLHGEPRTTHDFDLVADLAEEHAAPLAARLQSTFYADEQMIRNAVGETGSFNVLHLASGHKIDVFVLRSRPFSAEELSRARRTAVVRDGPEVPFASAEDTLLTKLEWYRKAGEVSDQQWRDARGIVKQQRTGLDTEYCRRWADELGVRDLLERVLAE